MRINTLPEEDQLALARELGELSAAMGPTWLLESPILLPRPEDFPDDWRPDLQGAELMLERLLTSAGLGDLPFVLEPFTSEDDVGSSLSAWHRTSGIAAYFAGRDEAGALRFGVDVDQLEDPEVLSGIWAHEVAHAFRHVHQLGVADSELEEELTDLTTIALGFGCLTTNNAWRLRRRAELNGGWVRTETSTQRLGYLPQQAMAFALGLQVRLRVAENRPVDVRAIRSVLEPAQRETFDATLDLGEVEVKALVVLPPVGTWRRVDLPARLERQTLPEARVTEEVPDEALEPVIAFRVRHRARFTVLSIFTAMLGAVLGASFWSPWGALLFAVGPALIAIRRTSTPECSACERSVGLTAPTCPACHAQLIATIATRNDRFDAEARWKLDQAERSKGSN